MESTASPKKSKMSGMAKKTGRTLIFRVIDGDYRTRSSALAISVVANDAGYLHLLVTLLEWNRIPVDDQLHPVHVRWAKVMTFLRKHLSTLVKLFVTVAGLAYVLLTIPIEDIQQDLYIENWSWLVAAFILVVVSMFVRAYRWRLLLLGLDERVRYRRLVALYFAGTFFNTFLPSGFGGDAVRIIEVAKNVPASTAAGTVIVDRLTGIMSLLLIGLISLPFRPENFSDDLALVIALACLIGLTGGIVLLEGNLITRLGSWLPPMLSTEGDGPVAKLVRAVKGCGPKAVAGAFGVSMIFNLLLVSWWVAAAKALGHDVSFGYMMIVVPMMSIALLVPSISGLGVRESIAGPLFNAAGLADSTAVVLSLLVRVVMLVVSLLGAPIYLVTTIRDGKQNAAKTEEAQIS